MDLNPYPVKVEQPDLLDLGVTNRSRFESLSSVWDAAEALTSPDYESRGWGLERLIELDAVRQYPLVAYLFATQLTETDLGLRERLVFALSDVFAPNGEAQLSLDSIPDPERRDRPTCDVVQAHLSSYLAGISTCQVLALLQVAENNPIAEPKVMRLLKCCSYAGGFLVEILADRQAAMPVRKLAARFIGQIGYTDTIQALERQISRLEGRVNGKHSFFEAGSDDNEEADLLQQMKKALATLYAP